MRLGPGRLEGLGLDPVELCRSYGFGFRGLQKRIKRLSEVRRVLAKRSDSCSMVMVAGHSSYTGMLVREFPASLALVS